jgi:MFS family permease
MGSKNKSNEELNVSWSAGPSVTHPLLNPAFCLWWIGNSVSRAGDQFYFVALPWLILQITGSSVILGTVEMTAAIPRAALMLVGGVLTDRFSPRKIMMITACCRAILVASISALLWRNCLKVWELYVFALGFGSADAFASPAAEAYLPFLVAKDQLPAANSVSQSTSQVTTLVAPAPAGLFIKAFGTAMALLIDAVSFLFIIGALWRLPDPQRSADDSPQTNMMRSIIDALQYVRKDAVLFALMLILSAVNLAVAGPESVGIAFIAKQNFGSAMVFGLLMSALGLGGLIGTLIAGVMKQSKRGAALLLVSGIIGLCLGSLGLFQSLPALSIGLFILGGAEGFMTVQVIALLQQNVDQAMLGRVMGVLMFAAVGLIPISMAVTGFILQWNLTGTYISAGAIVLLATLLASTRQPVRQLD